MYFRIAGAAMGLWVFSEFIWFDDATAVTNALDLDSPSVDFWYFQLRVPRALSFGSD
jgi:hypothetical protein